MGGQLCRIEVHVESLNFDALTEKEKARLGPNLAEQLAIENGISMSDVLSLNHTAGDVSFRRGPAAGVSGAIDFSTSVIAMMGECDAAIMTRHIFQNPVVHKALIRAITNTLGLSSKAVVGKLSVANTSVEVTSFEQSGGSQGSGVKLNVPDWARQGPLASTGHDSITIPGPPSGVGPLTDRDVVAHEVETHHRLLIGIGVWLVLLFISCYCLWCMCRRCCCPGSKDQREIVEEDEDEDLLFTGH